MTGRNRLGCLFNCKDHFHFHIFIHSSYISIEEQQVFAITTCSSDAPRKNRKSNEKGEHDIKNRRSRAKTLNETRIHEIVLFVKSVRKLVLARVRNNGSPYQSNLCQFYWALKCCPSYRVVRNSHVSARRDLSVLLSVDVRLTIQTKAIEKKVPQLV